MMVTRVICDNGLRVGSHGVEIDVRLPWYRALPLSVVDVLEVKVDGERIKPENIRLKLENEVFRLAEMRKLTSKWWYILDTGTLCIDCPPIETSIEHVVDVTIGVTPPYVGVLRVARGHKVLVANRSGLKLGTTLYSLTNEFHSRQFSLEQLIDEVGRLNLGPGLEIVGFSAVKGFPRVSDLFADRFKEVLERNKLQPSCLGINADVSIDRDRPMNEDELVEYHVGQIEAAAKLGFPVARYQWGAGAKVIERLLPTAERLRVKLGLEIHAPHTVDHPDIMAYREMYQRMNSPFLGFIPDLGASARKIAKTIVNYYRQEKVSEEIISAALNTWTSYQGDPLGRRAAVTKAIRDVGASDSDVAITSTVHFFGRMNPAAWKEILPQVVHIHGKFFEFDELGNDPTVPYEELLPMFVNSGYDGYMSSEWEGHHWTDERGFPLIEKHHALCKRLLSGKSGFQ